jgi:hypothetical protein
VRLWSLHPKYLDGRGIVALWREGLLALAVLQGKTKGYTHHPQLERFRRETSPLSSLRSYLWSVVQEARQRGYRFQASKLKGSRKAPPIRVTTGQLRFEMQHLRRKLRKRSPAKLRENGNPLQPDPHPLFRSVPGGIEDWEKGRP